MLMNFNNFKERLSILARTFSFRKKNTRTGDVVDVRVTISNNAVNVPDINRIILIG